MAGTGKHQPRARPRLKDKPRPRLKDKPPAPALYDRPARDAVRAAAATPDRGSIQAKDKARRPARKPVDRPRKPKIRLGHRLAGAEHHGPGAGYPTVHEAMALDADQTANVLTCLRACHDLHADDLAIMAMMCLGFGENSWHTHGCNSGGYCGVFQLGASWQRMHAYTDVGYWAMYALRHGFYGRGGILALSKRYSSMTPGFITNLCQGAYANLAVGARYYDQYQADARWAVNTFGRRAGVGPVGSIGSSSGGGGSLGGGGGSALNNPEGVFKSADWAGNVENTFKFLRGGANEAAHMTHLTRRELAKLKAIGWKKS